MSVLVSTQSAVDMGKVASGEPEAVWGGCLWHGEQECTCRERLMPICWTLGAQWGCHPLGGKGGLCLIVGARVCLSELRPQ